MVRTTIKEKAAKKLDAQMKDHINAPKEENFTGDFSKIISTGSTLLDLSISGSRVRGGGLPAGILVEIFGPSQSGKTALLCEIAGAVERQGGECQFDDPEARLDQEFASLFDMNIKKENYNQPDTVTQVFKALRDWEPANKNVINGKFTDSLAALSTDMEMSEEEGDKMGMRRAKEFSEQLRKSCRLIKQRNILHVCSNQVRVNVDAGKYGKRYTSPGGEAVKFYASVRMQFSNPEKMFKKITHKGREIKKAIGIEVEVEVVKTVDSPYRKAPLIILYGYGIDDVRANLQYLKDFKKHSIYTVGDTKLDISMEESIKLVEDNDLIDALRNEVIDLWEEIEKKFESNRKKRR